MHRPAQGVRAVGSGRGAGDVGMPRLTPRERLIVQSMRPARPSYADLERQVRELESDNAVLLRELATARRTAGLPEVSYLSTPA